MKKCNICHRKFKKSKMHKSEVVETVQYGCLFSQAIKNVWFCVACNFMYMRKVGGLLS